jgi:hypothetical protein
MTLQRCSDCGEYLMLDGSVMSSDRIVSTETTARAKMRTLTAQINSSLYEQLESLASTETGTRDVSRILNEVVAAGLRNYKHHMT